MLKNTQSYRAKYVITPNWAAEKPLAPTRTVLAPVVDSKSTVDLELPSPTASRSSEGPVPLSPREMRARANVNAPVYVQRAAVRAERNLDPSRPKETLLQRPENTQKFARKLLKYPKSTLLGNTPKNTKKTADTLLENTIKTPYPAVPSQWRPSWASSSRPPSRPRPSRWPCRAAP